MNSFTTEVFEQLIMQNDYVKKCNSNKSKDINSLSYLIKRNMSQSDCIKLGIGIEKTLADIILHFAGSRVINIRPKNVKDKNEKDHLFCDETNKIIYYAELKANLNLDTEKSKSTCQKCLKNVNELQEKYVGYEIKWCLLGYRYISKIEMPNVISKKYKNIDDNVFGINEYFTMFGIQYTFTEDLYKQFLNKIADEMFDQ